MSSLENFEVMDVNLDLFPRKTLVQIFGQSLADQMLSLHLEASSKNEMVIAKVDMETKTIVLSTKEKV